MLASSLHSAHIVGAQAKLPGKHARPELLGGCQELARARSRAARPCLSRVDRTAGALWRVSSLLLLSLPPLVRATLSRCSLLPCTCKDTT